MAFASVPESPSTCLPCRMFGCAPNLSESSPDVWPQGVWPWVWGRNHESLGGESYAVGLGNRVPASTQALSLTWLSAMALSTSGRAFLLKPRATWNPSRSV